MLRINRLRIEINTVNGIYGIDQTFPAHLNFIASKENTCGKSSILAAIYYCLGFEQILGGVGGTGSKVLTAVFKSTIDDDGEERRVTESGAFLEISNGNEAVTVHRNIKSEGKSNSLITVYYGCYDDIKNPKTESEDFYVNVSDGATSDKGFHAFLESFIHLELPLVRTTDGREYKLYLQMVFSSMFIEQKNGWSGIFAGMPYFGIRESKRRVVEFILGLDILKNEKEKERLGLVKSQIERDWEILAQDVQRAIFPASCDISNFPARPRILTGNDYSRIEVLTRGTNIADEIEKLKLEYNALRELKPRVTDNFEALNNELSETEAVIFQNESKLREIINLIANCNGVISRLTSDLEIINCDIRNNRDAARLQKFGSETADGEWSVDICPTCKQRVDDNLLSSTDSDIGSMTIEENIRHLTEQKKMLEFTLNSRKIIRDELQRDKQNFESELQTLRRLALTLRSDLNTATNTDASEAIILKRIEISKRIESMDELLIKKDSFIERLKDLSNRWNTYLDQKGKLPKSFKSESDEAKIKLFKEKFITNLKRYNYSSLSSFDGIDISDESMLPTIDGFDMKFDSSASDGVRMIWAFTMALLQVSIETNGNHPSIVIFDEPTQQNIISEDVKSFIDSLVELGEKCQIIIAITLNSNELVNIINELKPETYSKSDLVGKAFKLLDKG